MDYRLRYGAAEHDLACRDFRDHDVSDDFIFPVKVAGVKMTVQVTLNSDED